MNQALPESAITHDSDFIIFGGSGDLSIRKIFPALFWRFLNGQITHNFRLISCMRNVLTKSLNETRYKHKHKCKHRHNANSDTKHKL